MHLLFTSQTSVVFDGEAVRLILDPGDQLEPLRVIINGQFYILIIKAAGTVKIILHHATDGDIQPQLFHHSKSHIYLALSAIHQDKIREAGKTPQFLVHLFFFQLFLLLQTMGKAPGQNFFQAGIIIWPIHRFNLKFSVIAALRFPFFKHHHRSNRLETADIRDVIGFHAADMGHSQKLRDLFYRADGPAFFPLNALPILVQNNGGVFPGQFHQFFLCSLFGYTEKDPLPPLSGKPLLQQFMLLHLYLQHQFPGDEGSSGIKLFDKAV